VRVLLVCARRPAARRCSGEYGMRARRPNLPLLPAAGAIFKNRRPRAIGACRATEQMDELRTADELTNAWKKGGDGDGEEEDALRFRVFVDPAPGADAHAHAALLDDVARVLAAHVAARAKRYLWHREPITIERAARRPPGEEVHLAGELRYGDNVEDEWFGVWLLLELTAAFPALGVTAEDAQDGQLLLIEAAHVLPDWLSPESAGNRVLLRGGNVLQLIQQQTGFILPGGSYPTLPGA
jgi:hypothetical protein